MAEKRVSEHTHPDTGSVARGNTPDHSKIVPQYKMQVQCTRTLIRTPNFFVQYVVEEQMGRLHLLEYVMEGNYPCMTLTPRETLRSGSLTSRKAEEISLGIHFERIYKQVTSVSN